MSDKAKIRMRLRCPQCGSLDSIKWGVRDGIQRYKCSCGYLFSGRRKEITASNHFVWFKKWVSGRMAIDEIADRSGYSTRQLHRWFDEYLDSSPSWTMNTSRPIYLLIDGTYYSDNHCLILYRAENLKRTIFIVLPITKIKMRLPQICSISGTWGTMSWALPRMAETTLYEL